MHLRFNYFEFIYSGKLKEGHFALFLGEILYSYRAFLHPWFKLLLENYMWRETCTISECHPAEVVIPKQGYGNQDKL